MKKTMLMAMAAMLGGMVSVRVLADEATVNGFTWGYTTYPSSSYSYVNSVNGAPQEDLVIPSRLGGYDVWYFSARPTGEIANAIKKITIPATLRSFSNSYLLNCTNLESFVVEEGSSYLSVIDGCLMRNGTVLCAVPAGVETVLIPGVAKSISSYAFTGLPLIKRIEIPEGVETLNYYTFYNCVNLEEVSLPSSLNVINSTWGATFFGCAKLRKLIVDARNAVYMSVDDRYVVRKDDGSVVAEAPSAMCDQSVSSVTISEALSVIPSGYCRNYTNLTSIVIPAKVKTVGANAFAGCSSLRNVTIEGDACVLAESIFDSCPELTSITFTGKAPSSSSMAFLRKYRNTIQHPDTDEWNSIMYGRAGFVFATFTGSAYNGTSDIWAQDSGASVLSAAKLYYSSNGSTAYENTTFAYGAFMYMKGGVRYQFKAAWDDYASVIVDDMAIVPQTVGCSVGTGSIQFKTSGWHKIDVRVSNSGGPCGSHANLSFYGAYYSTDNGATWKQFVDTGDGTLFRTECPKGETAKDDLDVGEAGFRMAVLGGAAYSEGDIWSAAKQYRMVYPSKIYTKVYQGNHILETTTYAYGAYMMLEKGVTYRFLAYYDDYATVKIEGRMVVGKGSSECMSQTGSYTPARTGWHKVEFRVSNNGGNGGALVDSENRNGILFCTSRDSTWRRLTDWGTGELFRVGSEPADFLEMDETVVGVLNSSIRENDPTILDVTYRVFSKEPKVKVRVLAFEDGERSFAKVVRPETFVDGTEVYVGDNVTPNVEHTISWRVSSDWQTKLAKVKFEVMACEGELLPLELMTIPASDQYGKMKISWNAISESQWFDALLWLYADKDANLTLSSGSLRNKTNNQELANGANLSGGYSYYDSNGSYVGYHWELNSIGPQYIFNKMGYSLLTGAPLTYANSETRLGLSPSGARQYAYRIVEE